MDLILEDKEGNRVHASILKQFISSFDKKINEYNCYQISKTSFASYSDKFKYVENSHKLNFSKKTDVKLCDDFGGSVHTLNFTTIDDLLSEKIPIDTCIDVIGIIKDNVSVQDITKRNGKPAKKLSIDLYGSNKIGMTLWDSYAINVRSYIENNPEEALVVIILQFATYKPFEGEPSISNALSITKLIINEEIPEIVEFKKSFLQMINSETSSSTLLSPLSIRDPYFEVFVNETDFSNIGEVEDIESPMKVVICGTIMPSSNYKSWYYVGCKTCATQLREDNKVSHQGEIVGGKSMNQFRGKYNCLSKKCNDAIVDAVARYRVPFDVKDSTRSLSLTLWEGQAVPIFKITAMKLFKKLSESGDITDIIPKEIEAIEG